MKEDTDR